VKVWTYAGTVEKISMFYNLKKIKKVKKGKLVRLEFKSNVLKFGTIGLKAAESGIINSRQIEAARQAIVRKIKKKGKIWIKIFLIYLLHQTIGVRMGKGKGPTGELESGGNVLFEVCGVNFNTIIAALKTGGAKLPIRTKFSLKLV
jgi:large subunit ribosomal protein L16